MLKLMAYLLIYLKRFRSRKGVIFLFPSTFTLHIIQPYIGP